MAGVPPSAYAFGGRGKLALEFAAGLTYSCAAFCRGLLFIYPPSRLSSGPGKPFGTGPSRRPHRGDAIRMQCHPPQEVSSCLLLFVLPSSSSLARFDCCCRSCSGKLRAHHEQTCRPDHAYDRAKDAFKSGQLDKALELTDKLATATPPADSTERARVLRAVIYTGELKSAKELAEAYSKGAEKSKNPQFQADYRRLQNDSLSTAAKAALNLAETAHQLAPDGAIAKELTLEASYPHHRRPTKLKSLRASKRAVGSNLTSRRARRRIAAQRR